MWFCRVGGTGQGAFSYREVLGAKMGERVGLAMGMSKGLQG